MASLRRIARQCLLQGKGGCRTQSAITRTHRQKGELYGYMQMVSLTCSTLGTLIKHSADGKTNNFGRHMRQLEQAKKAFTTVYLLVGVTGDAETHKRKGLTVLSGSERAETVRHCKWVDEVIPNCPWIVTPEFLEEHKIDYVAHDDLPYGADEGDDIYKPIKEKGMFLVTQRTEGVSTTGIITKYVLLACFYSTSI